MTYMKKALLATLAVLAFAAFLSAGSASATVLCKSKAASHVCPYTDVYGNGTNVMAQSEGEVTFKNSGSVTIMKCSGGSFAGTVSDPGSATSSVSLDETSYEFSGCSNASSLILKGIMGIEWTSGTHNGSVFEQLGNRVRWTMSGSPCTYTISVPAEVEGGSSAKLRFNETKLTLTEGNLSCRSEMKMTATYAVSSPAALYVEHEAEPAPKSVFCKSNPETHKCSAEDVYGVGTEISGQSVSGTSITLSTKGGSVLAKCTSGSFSGVVANAGGESSTARVSEVKHAYSGCTTSVTPLSTGEMTVNWISGTTNGVATQTGGEVEWVLFGEACTYSITGGEIVGGAAPKLVYKSTIAVKTAGGELCVNEARVKAEYNIESPTPLYVEQ